MRKLLFLLIFYILSISIIYPGSSFATGINGGVVINEHFFLFLYETELTGALSIDFLYFSQNKKNNFFIDNKTTFFYSNIYLKNTLWYKTDKTQNFDLINVQKFYWKLFDKRRLYLIYGLSLNNFIRLDIISIGILYYYKDFRYSFIPAQTIGLGINFSKKFRLEGTNDFGIGAGFKNFYIFYEYEKTVFELSFYNSFDLKFEYRINKYISLMNGYQNRFLLLMDSENFLGKGFWLNHFWSGVRFYLW